MGQSLDNSIPIQEYIIYEDDQLVVLNKPSGVLSIADGYHKVLPNLRDSLINLYGRIWTIHRLDKLTSGVIIFAKDEISHRFLNSQFEKRTISKKYTAIVFGFPIWVKNSISLPLVMNGDRKHRTVLNEKSGKMARTDVEIVNKFDDFSLLNAYPKTGYTHQIRCHLSLIGFPIVGDPLYTSIRYKDPSLFKQADRMFLHAESITIQVQTGKTITHSAPLPSSYDDFLLKSIATNKL